MDQPRIPCPECGTLTGADGKARVQCPRCGWMPSDHDSRQPAVIEEKQK